MLVLTGLLVLFTILGAYLLITGVWVNGPIGDYAFGGAACLVIALVLFFIIAHKSGTHIQHLKQEQHKQSRMGVLPPMIKKVVVPTPTTTKPNPKGGKGGGGGGGWGGVIAFFIVVFLIAAFVWWLYDVHVRTQRLLDLGCNPEAWNLWGQVSIWSCPCNLNIDVNDPSTFMPDRSSPPPNPTASPSPQPQIREQPPSSSRLPPPTQQPQSQQPPQSQQQQNTGVPVSIVPGSASLTTDAYQPNPVQVSVGETVTWTNDDSQPHTVTSGQDVTPDGRFDSGIMVPDATFEHTFTEAGEYRYFCLLYPNMAGTVQVD
ncbi:MAG: plastocyanin/azurin family copper-binding protein [Thermoproteota archaeon]|nr:plastocyanin/azurin family copper-binding protein [Thermoproteota archaeon]